MRVLVVDEQRAERETLVALLMQRLHRVEGVADVRAALRASAEEPAQVVVLGGGLPRLHQGLRGLRAAQGASYTYILTILGLLKPGDLAALYDAGMDDFVRRPLFHEEVVARVETPMRIRAYA